MKNPDEYKGNFKVYNDRCDQRWQYAEKQIEDILYDDDKWNLFLKQLKCRKGYMVESVKRKRKKLINKELKGQAYKDSFAWITLAYETLMPFVCDECSHSSKLRLGQRKYTKPRKFHCDTPYINDLVEKLEKHTNPNKPPKWLDVENNICPYYEEIPIV